VQVIRQLPEKPKKACVLALGNFDGVHLGHQRLLESGLEIARKRGLGLSVLLFEPHPLKLLFPERMIGLLTTSEQRLRLLEELGIDTVYLLPFTHQMAAMTPEKFVSEIILQVGAQYVVVGFNYSFGSQGKGTPEDLQSLGDKYGFGVSVLQAQTMAGQVISSSSIRKALLEGDVRQVQIMLGRYPCLYGKVVKGEQRGRTLGYPTANLEFHEDLLIPKRGSYAVWTEFDGKKILGMMNIGMKPTFHDEYMTTIEVHFFDFQGDLYQQELNLNIVERLRDERKFSGVGELLEQLNKDAIQAKRILEHEEKENRLYKFSVFR
jgi:riboflavin kinase/FMN adenylyltransferase